MKTIHKLGLAAILLAGSSLTSPAVFAQENQPSTEILQPNSAKGNAPGQTKTDGELASGNAPGQMQKSGEVEAAKDAAPGQVKKSQSEIILDPPLATGGNNSAKENAPGQTKADGSSAADDAPGQMQKSGEVDAAKDAAPGQVKQDRASSTEPSDETTGSIEITTEQTAEIRNIIRETAVEPVSLDVDLRVGIEAPRTVEVHPLPPRLVEIVPAYRGYEYFVLVDGRVVIVEPATHRVVYILTV